MNETELLDLLRDKLELRVDHRSTDPDDDACVVELWWGDEKLTTATLL